MNTGIQFEQFVKTVKHGAEHREDVVARLNTCRLSSDEQGSVWTIGGVGEYDASPMFQRSVAESLRIPFNYYTDMQETFPALLDANVNSWLGAEPNSETRLMRLFDKGYNGQDRGVARAVRSTSFLPLDNDELLHQIQPVLDEAGVTIQSCEVGDRRSFLKITTPRLKGDVKVGDTVEAGLTIVNSEVGYGHISVAPFLYRLICTNGMATMQGQDDALKRIHRGATIHCYRPFTRMVDTDERRAAKVEIWRAVGEAVGAVLREATFRDLLERLKAAHKATVKSDGEKLMQHLAGRFALTDSEQTAALMHFETDSKERSIWGLANAVTRIANDTADYERATFLESVGGKIIELPDKEWHRLRELN